MAILLNSASGGATSAQLSLKAYPKGKTTLFVKATAWGAAAFSIEVSPNGTDWYATTIGGNADVSANTAAELDLNADYIRGVATTGYTDLLAELKTYP